MGRPHAAWAGGQGRQAGLTGTAYCGDCGVRHRQAAWCDAGGASQSMTMVPGTNASLGQGGQTGHQQRAQLGASINSKLA